MKRTFPAKVIEEEQRVIMTTAAAQAPAPGKLEFKDDYTPDEAERVIRNSKGLPVGVRPKMVWTWKKGFIIYTKLAKYGSSFHKSPLFF